MIRQNDIILDGFRAMIAANSPAPEIVPAETLQADEAVQPSRKLTWTLWALAIVLVGSHPLWVAAGMPVPAFLSPILEMLNV